MKCWKLCAIFTFLATCSVVQISGRLEEVFRWKEVEFEWPDGVVQKGYKSANNLPLGLDVWRNKLFITVPRWKDGVASSLNYIDLNSGVSSGKLRPYPNWEANSLPVDHEPSATTEGPPRDRLAAASLPKDVESRPLSNESIISTFRIRVDECDRLWVVDTGLADILGDPKQLSPPSLVIFDLNTDRLIRRYEIPSESIDDDSFFANIIVDTDKAACDDAFAYIPDLGAYAVLVYSFRENKSWRAKHNFFHFDPLQGDYNVAGVNFQWTDGVFGMAVGKPLADGSRTVYFHALSSTKEFAVNNRILQNETYCTSSDAYHEYQLLGDRGQNSQSTAEFYDPHTEVIFYTQVNRDAIGCWNTNKPFNPDNQGLVDSDSEALVFPNDLKVDPSGTLWVLSDRMPAFIYKQLDPQQHNFRILRGNTKQLIQGTPCDP
ncbi:L-dopachrome tautomerase yellow-f2 [Phlebotomus papatasi]|uniref:L-dopachrome tautomerase yellow-f2 n=1 Tax=Phlebotomus papatasi TaxID=29031 RepID=UPI00248392DC|nr:L-dopachrome tautomerase yellow-f2 [Phlebotomus papatasi]